MTNTCTGTFTETLDFGDEQLHFKFRVEYSVRHDEWDVQLLTITDDAGTLASYTLSVEDDEALLTAVMASWDRNVEASEAAQQDAYWELRIAEARGQ